MKSDHIKNNSVVVSDTTSDADLIRWCSEKNSDAWRLFLSRYRSPVFRLLRPVFGDHYSASEMTDALLIDWLLELPDRPNEKNAIAGLLNMVKRYRKEYVSPNAGTGVSPRQLRMLEWLNSLSVVQWIIAELILVQAIDVPSVSKRIGLTPDEISDIESRLRSETQKRFREKERPVYGKPPARDVRKSRPAQKHSRFKPRGRFDRRDSRSSRKSF